MGTLTLLGFGLLLGIKHASDPDHVVAVAAIAGRYKRVWPAALVGALWGLGHCLTIGVVGGLIIAFNLTVPPRVGLALEFVVGIALTVVGVLNLMGRGGFLTSSVERGELPKGKAFLLGLVHGLAGSAAVALLVLATVKDPKDAFLYLIVFGVGTLMGMMLITIAFASPIVAMADRFKWSGDALRIVTGLFSAAFGLYVMYQIGVVDGLFGAHPKWTPV
ncbi:MAG: HupE/UreJ family protein [Vicinamibacteria bacterium]